MQPRWRRFIGTLLLLTPLFALICCGLLAVLMGSLGMDIHWASKTPLFVAASGAGVLLCACVVVGIRLRKAESA